MRTVPTGGTCPALSTWQVQSFREPHASAIARLGGALGLPDEQINAMTALSTLKLRFYRHSASDCRSEQGGPHSQR